MNKKISDMGPRLHLNDVLQLEKQLSLNFPDDYKKFLLQVNGGVFRDYPHFIVESIGDIITVDTLLGIETGVKNLNILNWMDDYAEEMFENSLIIGRTAEHGFIVLICEGGDKGVHYWDHVYHFESSCDEMNTYFIAESFTEFLTMVEKSD